MSNVEFSPFPTMETEKLNLRKMNIEDREAIYRIRTDQSISRYIQRELYHSMDESISFIRRIDEGIEKNQWIYWVLADKASDEVMGTICLWNISEDGKKADIGYELLPEYQGRGYMTEALEKVVEYGLLKFESIEAYTNIQNEASNKLLKRCKFEFIKNIEEETPNGEMEIYSMYAIER